MSNQTFAAEQLLELLLQLKKTTPAAARSILNGQPQIAYALMSLMVTMNAVNIDVFQKTLAEYGNKSAVTPTPKYNLSSVGQPSNSSTSVLALPARLQPQTQQYRTATPPSQPFSGYMNGQAPLPFNQSYSQPTPTYPAANTGYGYAQPQPTHSYTDYGAQAPLPGNTGVLPDALAAIPEEQKALIMRVITMTPDQINALPPSERQTYIQLRAHLGVPI